jgi:hypothetical protein
MQMGRGWWNVKEKVRPGKTGGGVGAGDDSGWQ